MRNSHVLDHIDLKLRRAAFLTQEINSLTESFLQSDFYQVSSDRDRQGRLVMRFGEVRSLPPELSILIGEAAHHLRSALDHLMFLLARPTKGKEEAVQFPIATSRKNFSKSKWRMPGIAKGVLGVVESVQPYHSRKWPETRLLGQLQAINNRDKHRTLVVSAASLVASDIAFEIVGNTTIVRHEAFRGRVKPGKVIARLQMGYSEAGAKVYPKPKFGFSPVFDDGMGKQIRGVPILKILGGAGNFISSEVIPRFKRFL